MFKSLPNTFRPWQHGKCGRTDRGHALPLSRQAVLLRLSRSSLYYAPQPVPEAELAIMRRIDALHLAYPFAGSRMLRDLLRGEGIDIGREMVRTMMRRMGIEGLWDTAWGRL